MKVLFVTNDAKDARISRVSLATWLKKSGVKMDICAPCSKTDGILNFGDIHVYTSPRRWRLMKRFFYYRNLRNEYDAVVLRGIDTVVIGAIAFYRINTIVFYLTGLGKSFNSELRFGYILRQFYRNYLRILKYFCGALLVVQNRDDKEELNLNDSFVVNGSGLPYYIESYEKRFETIELCTAMRLTKEKGLNEIIGLAREISKSSVNISYKICGSYDHLSSKQKDIIKDLNQDSRIDFLGEVEEVNSILEKSNIVFYPTQYREGVPRFLIESLMHGNIIITNDVPGARECVKENGAFLTEPKQVISYISGLSENELQKMSRYSRNLYERKFLNEIVYNEFLEVLSNKR